MARSPVTETVQAAVLTSSRRRCCICFGLNRDLSIVRGQIAHLNKNPNNNDFDNLVFLCMVHHDEYDSRTSQSKSFRVQEIKRYRQELYQYWTTPEKATRQDIVLTAIQDIGLASHVWKRHFLALVPDGWKIVEQYSTGEIWGSMIAMTEELELKVEDWARYQSLFESVSGHISRKIESIVLLWGSYLSDDYKHKLQMSLRKLTDAADAYRMLRRHDPTYLLFLRTQLKETLMNLREICENADHEKSIIA